MNVLKNRKLLSIEAMIVRQIKRRRKSITILVVIFSIIFAFCLISIFGSQFGIKSNEKFIRSIDSVKYEAQLKPKIANDGNYTFVTDNDFKIMQLTDIHIGAGSMSVSRDKMALNAVASMIIAEKPDLVVVTGDIAFPIPFQSGTLNNKNSAKLFADLMEQLGVYWCPTFGNHDTEIYSLYSREKMAEFYASVNYPHCLLQLDSKTVDGNSNYVVNIKNTQGEITQSIIMIDSLSYVGGNPIDSIRLKYDKIHDNQVTWYKQQLTNLTKENNGKMPKSLAFFHIPTTEYKDAWEEYKANGFNDTENVKYYYGKINEPNELICCPEEKSKLFDTVLELGSTQGIFTGHDHLNSASLEYKGVRLSYGYSIDYLAYIGINEYGSQRGCTMITVSPDGSFDSVLENYYQDKYISPAEKETVEMNEILYSNNND